MITIDSLIGQMKSLFAIKTPVRFDTPEYIQFYNDLIQYIYKITLKKAMSGKSFPVILFTPQRKEWQREKEIQF